MGLVDLLIPLRGQSTVEQNGEINISKGRFDEYERQGHQLFTLTSLEDADIAVFPIGYPMREPAPDLAAAIEEFSETVTKAGKKTIVFAAGDEDLVEVKIPDATIFHISLYATKRGRQQFSWPQFHDDFIETHCNGTASYRSKPPVPTIGFCGYAPPLNQKWSKFKVKESLRLGLNYLGVMKRQPSKSAHSYRARALRSLMRQGKVKTNFIIREQFAFAGPYGNLLPGGTQETAQIFRKEYVENILDNDYNLCARGFANCSLRLYETLCCGRIPVFINTNCVLPYDSIIDWKKHVVWIEESDISRMPQLIEKFHNSLSDEEFVALQASNRELWQEYLSPEGFFKNLRRVVE